jgi:hypothetical protein
VAVHLLSKRLFLNKHEFSFLKPILMVSAKRESIFTCVAELNFHSTNELKVQEDHRRNEMKKFLTIVGLLTVVATPAFAQSYSHDFGTGNVIDTPALEQQAGRADANSAFAQAPEVSTRHKARVQSQVDSYSPANTGGGSEGYNWSVEKEFRGR